ncbi:B3 domain-containing transcription factor VRN1, partial [Camellia lanceoleosa]
RIPKKFAAKYGNELTSIVMLTVPNGRIWHLGVEKADNMLWFHDGWKEFAEHHSISCGFFVLFKYEENSKFNVHIFDLTACEIHYPRNTISISEEPSHGKQYPAKDEEEVEFLGVNTCSNSVTRQPVTTQEREKAVNAAMMFKPENPFFTAILRQYNVHRRCVLYVPASFARNHLNPALKFIELQVSGGKRWKKFSNPIPNQVVGKMTMATTSTSASASASLSAAIFAATVSSGRSSQTRKTRVNYIGGMNCFSGLKAHNNVASLGLPVCTEQSFAKIVSSLKLPSQGRGGGGGGALSSTCNAAAEIFKIAAIMNGLVLIGVAVGFVLLRIEASFEESE